MIYIENNKIRIQLFTKILRVSDNCIIVALNDKKITIFGKRLCITYLEKNEIIILGDLVEIKFLNTEEVIC